MKDEYFKKRIPPGLIVGILSGIMIYNTAGNLPMSVASSLMATTFAIIGAGFGAMCLGIILSASFALGLGDNIALGIGAGVGFGILYPISEYICARLQTPVSESTEDHDDNY